MSPGTGAGSHLKPQLTGIVNYIAERLLDQEPQFLAGSCQRLRQGMGPFEQAYCLTKHTSQQEINKVC